ncbi:MAG: 4-hydroxy-tetrahydrodipicolinate reductase [Prevotellaceae bacterium]|nr:4-hydroxy-tetrahydrodipicolinate reductase [Prevotellaceae bacterium]
MKIALIGYGKMGKIIEQQALKRGHQIVAVVDVDSEAVFDSEAFASADVAIEFTAPDAAERNIRRAWQAGIPVVSGTTGWNEQLPLLQEELKTNGQTLFWASNFSVGVNILFALNAYMATLMNRFKAYNVSIHEVHHINKKDIPSGTAITLAESIVAHLDHKTGWNTKPAEDEILIESLRLDDVVGSHDIVYDLPDIDTITLSHNAKTREGFALGAIMAAEYAVGKKGFLSMKNLLRV